MTIEMTEAKTGRSMKNFEIMGVAPAPALARVAVGGLTACRRTGRTERPAGRG